jgi:microcystin-dependent protein
MTARLFLGAATAACALATAAAADTTGVTGSGAPIDNYQPSLVLSQLVQTGGIFPCRDCANAGAVSTIGMIHTFAGAYTAFGMPAANGQLVSIPTNTAAFSILGTTYGGDGKSTFALPDLTGRAAVGAGAGPGLSPYLLGQQAGTAQNVMTLSQLPDHDHGLPGGGVTGPAGGSKPLGNIQPSLALNYQIAVNGIFPGSDVDPFIGQVSLFAGNFATNGYLPADGRLLPINDYQALFAVVGTTYGGDGQSTFALPDLRGRTVVGTGDGVSLGDVFGTEQTFLTEANLPTHDHSLPGGGFTLDEGGGQGFDNAQPSLGLNYLVALQGIFPPHDGSGVMPGPEAYIGDVVAFAGGFAPTGYAFANGQLLPINQNQALFAIIGCTYGGDCQSTFALPDLRGRTILGAGAGFNVGDKLGGRETTLTVAQLAPHVHDLPASGVPEPLGWALMIGGFGLAGAALRRNRWRAT